MSGLVGRLFREFAITLAIAVGISALLSLTLAAMMSAWILLLLAVSLSFWIVRGFERGFTGLTKFYDRTLQVVLRHRTITLLITLATVAVTVLLAIRVPKGFFPVEDTGTINAVTEAAPDVSFTRMTELQEQVVKVLLEDPDVATVSSSVGADGTNPTSNSGRMLIAMRARPTSSRASSRGSRRSRASRRSSRRSRTSRSTRACRRLRTSTASRIRIRRS